MEELLQWMLLKSQEETKAKCEDIIRTYQDIFDQNKKELLAMQEQNQAKSQINGDAMNTNNDDNNNAMDEDNDVENEHPNHQQITKGTTGTKSMNKSQKSKTISIQVQVTTGPHAGSSYTLTPNNRKPCWVGRSTSQKFKKGGMSLNKDAEVSTTHGKFHFHPSGPNGKLVYTDTGSTNGTIYNNEEIEANVPLELEDGMVIVLGMSTLVISLK